MMFHTAATSFIFLILQIHAISALSITARDRSSIIDVKVAGKPMKCELLPERISTQNHESRNTVCYLVEPFKGSRAVLKTIEMQPDIQAFLQAEADYAEKVGQHLYHSFTDDDVFFTLVLKDLRKGFLNDFRNTPTAPERKLFHEWYIEDTNMDVIKALDQFQESMFAQAMYHAEKHNLLFLDLHFLNALTDKTAYDTVFPDWAPSFDRVIVGVLPLPEDPTEKHERIEKFMRDLDFIIPRSISVFNLKLTLEDHGLKLREADMPAWRADVAARQQEEEAYRVAMEEWERYQAEERDRLSQESSASDSASDDSSASEESYENSD